MAVSNFPPDPTDLDVEMNVTGTWVNLRTGGYVLDRGISISRGRSDEAGEIEPSRLQMTLNNIDGRFSPRNPTGPYYGQLGRNTPVRASVTRGAFFLEMPGGSGDKVSAPDSAALSITGDIDVRVDITTDSWGSRNLCGKFKTTGNQRSWVMQAGPDGTLRLSWTTDGTASTAAVAISTVGIPMNPGRMAVRAALDVNNGAGSNTTTFYTADTIAGPWVQLGDPVVTALGTTGVTSIFDSTAPVELGSVPEQLGMIPAFQNDDVYPLVGRLNAFELRSGIGGTVVANPTFTGQPAGTTSVTDTAGPANTWTLAGNALVTNRRWRFYGELATIPPRWDVSGKDVNVPVEANGILRRLRQAESPLRSPIYRAVLHEAALVAYWPGEDSSGATSIASAIQGVPSMAVVGTASFASSNVFAASAPLPTVSKSKWTARVPPYASTGSTQVRFLIQIPADSPPANNTVLASVRTTGSAIRWDVIYQTASGGSITWAAYGNNADNDNGIPDVLFPAGGSTFSNLNGETLRISVELTQSGSNINAACGVQHVSEIFGAGSLIQTVTGRTFGRVSSILIGPNADVDAVTLGHISVHSAVTDLTDLGDELLGFVGESAGRRVQRLCSEEGIAFRGIGDLDNTAPMGVQTPGAIVDLLQECADADMGMLLEPRDMLGIGYRAHSSLYNQPARLALNYSAEQISDSLDPTDDDQQIRNDITASRESGSSFRVEQTTGRMSTAAPPNGVGRYDDSVTINVHSDEQLPDQAAWRVHVGTVDEARYPQIGANFRSAGFTGNAALIEALLMLEAGDRVTIANPPPWLPPDTISQITQGMKETFENYQHRMTLNCSPESPYRVSVINVSRIDTSGSVLAAAVTSTAATLSVSTTDGAIWTTSGADMPFNIVIGGEVMTVTAISGAASPQTFTVTRSINGVVKAQAAGTAVNLADQTAVAL